MSFPLQRRKLLNGSEFGMKQIVFQTSDTQRVAVESYSDGSWLISKEWRKQADDDWIQGKGIHLPIINGQPTAYKLGQILMKGVGKNGDGDPNESFYQS